MNENALRTLRRKIEIVEKEMRDIAKLFEELENSKIDYTKIPGIEGIFDGVYMITDSGEKHEVPANYAAKSRMVCGDRLKMIEEEGSTVFKQITKVPRKTLEAILNKKEGKFYALTAEGSYKISETAALYNKLQINDKVLIVIPADNPHVTFAAFDSVLRERPQIVSTTPRQQVQARSVSLERPRPVQSVPNREVSSPRISSASSSAQEVPRRRSSSSAPRSNGGSFRPRTQSSSNSATSMPVARPATPVPLVPMTNNDQQNVEKVSRILDDEDLR